METNKLTSKKKKTEENGFDNEGIVTQQETPLTHFPETNPMSETAQLPLKQIHVSSEIGQLHRLIVHSPDAGIGKVVPRKSQDWLYDDIVDIDKMRAEYNEYLQVLLWVLDPDKIRGKEINPAFFKPAHKDSYFNSDKVIDVEHLLIKILEMHEVRIRLVTHVCAAEKCSLRVINRLLDLDTELLARVLITGVISTEKGDEFIFPPIPNLIFTRDIGIVVNNHLLLTKPAEDARIREAIITKYIACYALFPENGAFENHVMEINGDKSFLLHDTDNTDLSTVEGGDVMMISPSHLLIGCSERTSPKGIEKVIRQVFRRNVVQKVTVVKIPYKRDYMHIDTVFTQVKRNMWVVFGQFLDSSHDFKGKYISDVITRKKDERLGNRVTITQFIRKPTLKGYGIKANKVKSLKKLFQQISFKDFGSRECIIIRCAGGRFPYDEREQWTDACNLLALREGVVIGYDRNKETEKEFIKHGFKILKSADFIAQMQAGTPLEEVLKGDTLILLPSSELSRARGGSHCMSMPLLRSNWQQP